MILLEVVANDDLMEKLLARKIISFNAWNGCSFTVKLPQLGAKQYLPVRVDCVAKRCSPYLIWNLGHQLLNSHEVIALF